VKKTKKVKKKKMKVEDEKKHQARGRLWGLIAERGKAHLLASGGKGPQGADGGEPGISRALIGSAQVDRSVLSRLHLCPTHALSSRAYVTHRTPNTTRGRPEGYFETIGAPGDGGIGGLGVARLNGQPTDLRLGLHVVPPNPPPGHVSHKYS